MAQHLSNCEQEGAEMNVPTSSRTRIVGLILLELLSVTWAGVAVALSADAAEGDSE